MSVYVSQYSMIVWAPVGDVPPPMTPPTTRTMRFGAGTTGNSWYLVPSIIDSGVELRSKQIKSVRVTGKVTNANLQIYTWDVLSAINVADLEAGTNSATGDIPTPDTTEVTQSARYNINCPNAVLSTVRIEGVWEGDSPPDRIDELIYESDVQGVRR